MKILIFTLFCLIPIILIVGIFLLQTALLFGLTRLFNIKNASYRKSLKILLYLILTQIALSILGGMISDANKTLEGFMLLVEIVLFYFAFYYLIKKYYEKSWLKSLGIYVIFSIMTFVVTFAAIFGIRTYVMSPFQVYGPTMCDTLNNINGLCSEGFGEYLIVNKIGYRIGGPMRGDIVVLRPPNNTQDFYIKRVIGLPGETVKLQDGRVYIYNKERQDGWELPEDYLNNNNRGRTYAISTEPNASYDVPEGHYFVLGDNRTKSTDSRSCFRGPNDPECNDQQNHFLALDRIEGKAWVILWPFDNVRWLENPVY